MVEIRRCPTCGSNNIKNVRRDWNGQFKGKNYTVRDVEFYECPTCNEKLFDREAMQRIEAVSPAFAKSRRMKRSA
jgi:YgiT-type zinc finger domain-containing protein